MLNDEISNTILDELIKQNCIVLGCYCINALKRNAFSDAMTYAEAHEAISGSRSLVERVIEAEIEWHKQCIEMLEK